MKPVVQRERTGCGIASVAALAGVSYAHAKRMANRLGISAEDDRLWSDTQPVRSLLAGYQIRASRAEQRFATWAALPEIALLAIKWHRAKGRACWHWVVFWRSPLGPVVLDSKQALRRHIRTDFGRMKPKWWIKIEPVRAAAGGNGVTRTGNAEMKEKPRCSWAGDKPHMIRYHDTEWGKPVHRDRKHFEMLLLEGAQAGLTWDTVLRKRSGYRKAFEQFDPKKVARFMAPTKAALLKNPGIIRNRLKIDAAVTNARAFLAVQKEFGSFDAYVWSFVGGEPIVNCWTRMQDVPATNAVSDTLSKDLKKRGFRFVGSTIIYAYMQAVGMVNDHLAGCVARSSSRKAS